MRHRGACASKGRFHVQATVSVSSWRPCASGTAAGTVLPLRSLRPVTGATPQSEGLVRARGQVCFHTQPPPSRGRSRSNDPYAGRRFERRVRGGGSPRLPAAGSGVRASTSKSGVAPMAWATAQAAKSGTCPSQVTDGLPARDCWTGATSRRRVDGRAHPNPPRCRTRHRKRGVAPATTTSSRAAPPTGGPRPKTAAAAVPLAASSPAPPSRVSSSGSRAARRRPMLRISLCSRLPSDGFLFPVANTNGLTPGRAPPP